MTGVKVPLQDLVDQGDNAAGAAHDSAVAGGRGSWKDMCKHSLSRCKDSFNRAKAVLRPYFIDEEEEKLANGEPLNGGLNRVVTSYMLPGEYQDRKRFFLTVAVVSCSFGWWANPMLGIFVADPMIQLILSNIQVLTPRTDCYDNQEAVQFCEDAGIKAHYFFYNITNVEEWLAGDEPPDTVEVGPYVFTTSEVHYNLGFDKNWTQVDFSYHSFETFAPALSCPSCTLGDQLTVINRGYQQFYAAMRRIAAAMSNPDEPPALPEEQVKVILLPLTLADIAVRMTAAVTELGSANPQLDMLRQWVNCGFMNDQTGGTEFFLPTNASDPVGITYAPELCHTISTTLQAVMSAPDPIPSTSFAALNVDIPLASAGAWLGAAIGATSEAGPDPAAQAFVTRFLLLSRTTNLAYLAGANPDLHAALEPITEDQWNLLKAYLMGLTGTYSTGTYSLFMAFGGAQIIQAEMQRVASKWTTMAAPTPEQAMVYTFLPLAVRTMLDAVTYTAMLPQVEATMRADPALAGLPADQPLPEAVQEQAVATAAGLAVQQWTDCSVLGGAALPVGPGGFPHPPEFCAFLVANADSLGFNFPVTSSMLADLGLVLPSAVATAFLQAVAGESTATTSDPFAQSVIQTFMMAPNKDAALGWLASQGSTESVQAASGAGANSAAQAAAMAPLTDLQFQALQLYLISLLPSWGNLVYTTWVNGGQTGPGASGIVVTRTVHELLYGYEDPILLASAQMSNPTHYRLAPYLYTVFVAPSFPSAEWPLEYFTNVTGTNYTYNMLSYKVTDVGAFHPLVQQKTLLTGKRQGDWPNTATMYRGIPYFTKPQGILNSTGINEGIVQGSNFNPDRKNIQYESALVRTVKVESTASHIRVKKVKAYQMTMHEESSAECNTTLYNEWKAATGFDEATFQAAMASITTLQQTDPDAYWELIQDEEALTSYFEGTALGPLSKYFGKEQGAWLPRCASPEPAPWAWDISDVYACPTLVTLPRFYKSGEEVVNSTGRTDWDGNFAEHGWYFSVEPFTGMSIHGHKPLQFNHLVTRTDVAYPDLWVAEGSRDSELGRVMGMDADFVTVPLANVLLYWEPTRLAAMALRGIAVAKEVLYWLLVVAMPIFNWLILFPALIYLNFSKYAKLRRKELKQLQKSTAKKIRLGRHETAMAEALDRLAHGSKSVFLPPEREYTSSDTEEEERAEGEMGAGDGSGSEAGVMRQGKEQRRSRLSAFEAKSAAAGAAAASAERRPSGQEGFMIGTAPQAPSDATWGSAITSGAPGTSQQNEAEVYHETEGAVAVTLLPPGKALSAAAPASFRRSTGTGSHLRKRTTSTQEGP